MDTETVIRYVPTYVDKDGTRTLMRAADGRATFATRAEAQAWLDAVIANGGADAMRSAWGANPRFDVRPCECSAGDFVPKEIYFECW